MAPKSKKAGSSQDTKMTDAPAPPPPPPPTSGPAGQNLMIVEDDGSGFDKTKIRILPGSTDTAASFEFTDEDHTLGNALRYIIMKNPDVEFCGYSIPHPSEPKMNIRIQTYEGTTAYEALYKGLNDMMDLCDVVTEKFVESRNEFAKTS